MIVMSLKFDEVFPFWDSLTEEQQRQIQENTLENFCPKKTRLHFGGGECAGV